eukprot:TRINITY_DN7503_c0_g1_i3.p1 TRINITY_DN7503_c0_g1~~TRINITY_DN7503_c0_g1_i3.p1  ORF type:complete len:569 (-),score=103.68 TRINITY_DN7503_c0_g1_i3:533-2239(-)
MQHCGLTGAGNSGVGRSESDATAAMVAHKPARNLVLDRLVLAPEQTDDDRLLDTTMEDTATAVAWPWIPSFPFSASAAYEVGAFMEDVPEEKDLQEERAVTVINSVNDDKEDLEEDVPSKRIADALGVEGSLGEAIERGVQEFLSRCHGDESAGKRAHVAEEDTSDGFHAAMTRSYMERLGAYGNGDHRLSSEGQRSVVVSLTTALGFEPLDREGFQSSLPITNQNVEQVQETEKNRAEIAVAMEAMKHENERQEREWMDMFELTQLEETLERVEKTDECFNRTLAPVAASLPSRLDAGDARGQRLAHSLAFADKLRRRELPSLLRRSDKRLNWCQVTLKECVETLYWERIAPTCGEMKSRLRNKGWSSCELGAVLALGAREPDVYWLIPPRKNPGSRTAMPARLLLKRRPLWFVDGFARDDSPELCSATWSAFKAYLDVEKPIFRGGVRGAALELQRSGDEHLRGLRLGLLRHLVEIALSGQRPLLAFDYGNRLRLARAEEEGSPRVVPAVDAADYTAPSTNSVAADECFDTFMSDMFPWEISRGDKGWRGALRSECLLGAICERLQ